MEKITGSIQGVGAVNGTLVSEAVSASGTLSLNFLPYKGDYEFTPSSEQQIINIMGMTATENILINPVPNNYGLITWNGAYLHIS